MLRTKIDDMVNLLQKKRRMSYYDISKAVKWEENYVEKVCLILEQSGYAKTHYPVDMIRRPGITLLKPAEKMTDTPGKKGKALEEYNISADSGYIRGQVRIVPSKKDKRPLYDISLPKVSKYTRCYLEFVKKEASRMVSQEHSENIKKDDGRYHSIAALIERDLFPKDEELDSLAGIVVNEMFGLGSLEVLLADRHLEEVVINCANLPVSVYHRKYGWLKSNVYVQSEHDTENFAAQIARKVGRQISLLSPILDARLTSGDRANATLFPISATGNTLTLRLFSKNPWTVTSFLDKENRTMSVEMAAMLWQAMQYEMNVVIAGGTASGKTSALNGLLALIPPYQRIVTIEDTRELSLPTYQWNWVPLITRPPNPEGHGEVTMLDLVVNSLRMRPDRIVMGEIRRKREAEVLFEAMHTGHSVYSTLHADTGTQVIKRLTEPPIEVPESEVEDIHLLLVQYRDRRLNIRRTLELSEIIPRTGMPTLNRIFTYKARNDSFEMVKMPHRYTDQMNLHTGMTEKEIRGDQKNKSKILQWMIKNKLVTVDEVGKVMRGYYNDESAMLKAAEKDSKPSKVL